MKIFWIALGQSVDEIYGYSYSIPKEFWVGYFGHYILLPILRGARYGSVVDIFEEKRW